jgi:hypothetical protein
VNIDCIGKIGKITINTNQPPTINAISNATINAGDTYSVPGSFTDSDSGNWTGTVNYGDGGGDQPLTLSGKIFSLNHIYNSAGTYTITVNVTDNQGATGTTTTIVTVVAPTTVTFDDISPASPFKRTNYGGINWSGGIWEVDPAIPTDNTNNASFDSASIMSSTFAFISPKVLISMGIYSNQNQTAMITLSCSGNPNVSKSVTPNNHTTLTTNWTVPCTTVTVTSSNGWNTSLDNIVYASASNVTPTPTPVHSGQILGNTDQGSLIDTGDSGYMNGTKFTTGTNGGTAQSMSVFVSSIDNSTHNQYQMAIYKDKNGKPGTLVAKTATGNLTALSWNSLPITGTLSANTTYWLMYNNNGRAAQNLNNLYYDPASTGTAAWAKQAFGTWPTNFPTATMDTTNFSIYVTYQ